MKKYKIVIPLSKSDLDELRNGETHNWTFPAEGHDDIEIECKLINEDLENEDMEGE